ncbi:MAG: hypothetical protein OCU22_00305 [Canidatus Methanoxibalbensis ujae]|nr:hypothetical protein [Candidatus Methanoxibalbensis ujae]
MMNAKMRIGLDIGGANIKVASSDCSIARTIYAPLWKDRTALHRILSAISYEDGAEGREELRSASVGVVMTGQLCDCFRTKAEGIIFIKNAVVSIFRGAKFFSTNCSFENASVVDSHPLLFDATNWLASSFYLSKDMKNFIFTDVGSTTTDVIPVVKGEIRAAKRDYERLMRNELIYEGVLRTNIAFICRKFRIKGVECAASSELFAITADAYLALGLLSEEGYTCDTPESGGAERTKEAALRRLSRVVCADLEEIGHDVAMDIARQVRDAQVKHLADALREKRERYNINVVFSAGIGEFIVREAADMINMETISASEIYGKDISAVFPSFAVSNLLSDF